MIMLFQVTTTKTFAANNFL